MSVPKRRGVNEGLGALRVALEVNHEKAGEF